MRKHELREKISLATLLAACFSLVPRAIGRDRVVSAAVVRGCVYFGAIASLIGCRCRSDTPHLRGQLEPLGGTAELALEVRGQAPSVVAVPLGARRPRPLLIALHGAADRPEWQCNSWRSVTGGRAFVLCPRGIPVATEGAAPERFGFETPGRTSEELRTALAALKKRFPKHLASAPVVLTGFDVGAEHALYILRQEPSFFARVVLVSGKEVPWLPTLSAIFGEAGGKRVLFVCTSRGCDVSAARAETSLRLYPVEVRRVFLGEWGPVFDGRVEEALTAEWAWLTDGESAWEPE